jgi:hypothetical protein
MTFTNYFFFTLAYLIQYCWAVGSIYINYDPADLDPSLEGAATAGAYMVVYLMVIPFITSCTSAIAKLYDDKGKFTCYTIFLVVLSALQIIGMLVLAYVFMTYI